MKPYEYTSEASEQKLSHRSGEKFLINNIREFCDQLLSSRLSEQIYPKKSTLMEVSSLSPQCDNIHQTLFLSLLPVQNRLFLESVFGQGEYSSPKYHDVILNANTK